MEFERITRLHENGMAFISVYSVSVINYEVVGDPITRLALYEGLLGMDPAEAALKIDKLKAERDKAVEDLQHYCFKFNDMCDICSGKCKLPRVTEARVKRECLDFKWRGLEDKQ